MNEEQGLQVIEQALNLANSKGAFKLEESATIFTALTSIKNIMVELQTSLDNSKKIQSQYREDKVKLEVDNDKLKEPINSKTK